MERPKVWKRAVFALKTPEVRSYVLHIVLIILCMLAVLMPALVTWGCSSKSATSPDAVTEALQPQPAAKATCFVWNTISQVRTVQTTYVPPQ